MERQIKFSVRFQKSVTETIQIHPLPSRLGNGAVEYTDCFSAEE